jgi:hypothetical protein
MSTWHQKNDRGIRNWLIFAVGLGIAIWETLAEQADRPWLLGLAASMLGLPLFLRKDDPPPPPPPLAAPPAAEEEGHP